MTSPVRTDKAVSSRTAAHGLFLPVAIALLAALAAGCSAKRFDEIRPGIEERGHYIGGVPFVRQEDRDCGPAALAGVLSFWKHPIDLAEITSQVYLPKLGGTLPMDMERFVQQAGLQTSTAAGTIDSLRSVVRSGRPVICMLDTGFGLYRQPHYITVIGFDDGNRLFIFHDGVHPNVTMSYEDFEKVWSRAGHWMLVAATKE